MDILDVLDRFQLDNDQSGDEQSQPMEPHLYAIVDDRDLPLSLIRQACISERDHQCVLVHRFQEPGTQRRVDLDRGTDDPFRKPGCSSPVFEVFNDSWVP